eukprot:TRINITY_DN2960_c0_g1_i2.p1 TRINITY_DN2960_c0_g1~~TRINITY_DN2960_c0_g1_i2.p1  ORF type:complete len:282 (+),score=60.77 TRINITY_DN2960_c0_g1_i2:3-848(+)
MINERHNTNSLTISLSEIISLSDAFPIDFPTQSNRIKSILKTHPEHHHLLLENAQSSHMIISTSVMRLISDFIELKQNYGSSIEQSVYMDMTADDFIKRLFLKRTMYFYGHHDISMLRDGTVPPAEDWLLVGTEEEGEISLVDYLSYDEMQVSALLCASTDTYFINDGSRSNSGGIGDDSDVEREGVIIGAVGARFEKKDRMEAEYCYVSGDRTNMNGYGKQNEQCGDVHLIKKREMWARFFDDGDGDTHFFPSYTEVEEIVDNNPYYFAHKPNKWIPTVN